MTPRLRQPAVPQRTVPRLAVLLAGLVVLFPARLLAQEQVVIYRCTDAGGAVTIQNGTPCPAGSRQQMRRITTPPPAPAPPVPAPPAPVDRSVRVLQPQTPPPASNFQPAVAVQPDNDSPPAATPPPPLFRCTTWDDTAYLTEDDTPAERCAPLRIVGMSGRARPGLGSACQTVRDTCQAVAEDALCQAWQRRVDEAEFRWKFAGAASDDPRKAEYEEFAAVLAASNCAD